MLNKYFPITKWRKKKNYGKWWWFLSHPWDIFWFDNVRNCSFGQMDSFNMYLCTSMQNVELISCVYQYKWYQTIHTKVWHFKMNVKNILSYAHSGVQWLDNGFSIWHNNIVYIYYMIIVLLLQRIIFICMITCVCVLRATENTRKKGKICWKDQTAVAAERERALGLQRDSRIV